MDALKLTMVEALNRALNEAMAEDPEISVLGEDIGALGGLFGVTSDLYQRYPGRVLDTPISELGFTGMGVGMAMSGGRPVVELQIIDFFWLALDQIVNAGYMHWMSKGQVSVPIVVRGPCCLGTGFGATHSQRVEGVAASRPGLKVVVPSTPADARSLLRASIDDPGPVVFVEDVSLYYRSGEVPVEYEPESLGKAVVRTTGTDITVIAYGRAAAMATALAEGARSQGDLSIEVVDLRTVKPLDWSTIRASVAKTRRVLAIQDGTPRGSIGEHVVAQLAGEVGGALLHPPSLLSGADVAGGVSSESDAALVVSEEQVRAHIESLISASVLRMS